MQKIRAFLLFALACVLAASAPAAQDDDVKDVLFVGNSYTFFNNMPQVVKAFLREREIENHVRKSTVGGAKLEEHWNSERGLKTREKIQSGEYDVVIIQGFSKAALEHREKALNFGGKLIDEAHENGSEPVLFQTWARLRLPSTQETISAMYAELAEKHDARIAPVGRAWQLAHEEWPDVSLYVGDGSHPNPLGSYLAACVFFETITGQSCLGLTSTPKIPDLDGELVTVLDVSNEDAFFCQRMAHQAVAEMRESHEKGSKQ